MSLVKIVACCFLIGFLVTSDLAPGNADILTFHKMLANFSSGKHLPTHANMASDGHRASATLATDTESRIYAISRVTGIYAISQVTGIWALSQVTGIWL